MKALNLLSWDNFLIHLLQGVTAMILADCINGNHLNVLL